ncbi:unnamed protein product [Cunninghamella echinulata]
MPTEGKQQRIFSPVILFHDHQYVKDNCIEHIHIPYGDPYYGQHIEGHKRRVSRMLENNGKFWSDVFTWSKDHALAMDPSSSSPVPSLASSPTPPLQPRDLPSSPPPYSSASSVSSSSTSSRRNSTATAYSSTYRFPSNDHLSLPHPLENTSSSTTTTAGSVLVSTTATTATTISSNGKTNKRRRGNLPKAVTLILKEWLSEHKKHPYPTEEEKDALAKQTGLTLNQISNWFINARRRILQPMLEQEDAPFDRRLRKRSAAEPILRRNSSVKKLNTRRRS